MSGMRYSTQSCSLHNVMCNVTVCVSVGSCIDSATNSALTSVHIVLLKKIDNTT
jgi:hypothetical protein